MRTLKKAIGGTHGRRYHRSTSGSSIQTIDDSRNSLGGPMTIPGVLRRIGQLGEKCERTCSARGIWGAVNEN